MKKLAIVLGVLVLLGCGKQENVPTQQNKPTATAEPSLYAKVASIDAGAKLTEESPETMRVKQAVQQAAALCHLPEEVVAGKAVKVKAILEEKKVAVKSVELLEMMPLVYNEKTVNDCSNILVHYAGVRTSGMSHAESVASLSALTKAISK